MKKKTYTKEEIQAYADKHKLNYSVAAKAIKEVNYCDIYDVNKLVKVRYLTGNKPGFEHVLKEPLAKIYEERGQVKILGAAKQKTEPKPDKKKELLKIATELVIKKADKMTEKELIEAIELAQAEK